VAIEATRVDAIDRVTLTFSDTQGLLHGSAQCIDSARWAALAHTADEPRAGSVLALTLDEWAHDGAWAASPVTQTTTITDVASFSRVSFAADPLSSRGATIGISLPRALPFRVRLEDRPARIVVEVDPRDAPEAGDDPLGQPVGRIDPPAKPIFFLQNRDVWRFADGRTQPVTTTDELETSLAVSPDGETLAICRAPANSEPAALPYDVRASLWVMRADGSEERQLADVGGCADLQFAPSGKTISFTANTAPAPPALLSVWTVPVVVGEPRPATPIGDEWSRWGAAWLPDSRLIYHARQGSGLSVLFIREVDGSEREVSSQVLTGPAYKGIGELVVGPDMLAVEALRANEDGADLVLLRFDGSEVAVERRAFWQRPLAFLGDDLFYLATECPSEVAQAYTLLRRRPGNPVEELLRGRSFAGIGEVASVGDALLVNRIDQPVPGLRGPRAVPPAETRSSLWAVARDGSARREIVDAPVPIMDIRPSGP
jgi:dipeptidyl aminopeptidase/acylaminoacyl peptidase